MEFKTSALIIIALTFYHYFYLVIDKHFETLLFWLYDMYYMTMYICHLGYVIHICHPSMGESRQEDIEYWIGLHYIEDFVT